MSDGNFRSALLLCFWLRARSRGDCDYVHLVAIFSYWDTSASRSVLRCCTDDVSRVLQGMREISTPNSSWNSTVHLMLGEPQGEDRNFVGKVIDLDAVEVLELIREKSKRPCWGSSSRAAEVSDVRACAAPCTR